MHKPDWLKVRGSFNIKPTADIVNALKINTICAEGACPNLAECWEKKHAAFMILGAICTRACKFCNVATGKPGPVDPTEPERIAMAVKEMGLAHVVVTSVDRDDLPDGGAQQFADVIYAIRESSPCATIEVLIPDFRNKVGALEIVLAAGPDVLNHNLETVPRFYANVRPGSRYFHSLSILAKAKEVTPDIFTKTGIMLGLGEEKVEILQVMDDARSAMVDFITIGQYLQPTPSHHPVMRYVPPQEFESYKTIAYAKGFLMVASSPFTRSSYHADNDFKTMQNNRRNIYHRAVLPQGSSRSCDLREEEIND